MWSIVCEMGRVGKGRGHESLSIILHFVQILLSVLDPTSRFSFLHRKENIAVVSTAARKQRRLLAKTKLHPFSGCSFVLLLCSHQESNLDRQFRKLAFYPLNYGSKKL